MKLIQAVVIGVIVCFVSAGRSTSKTTSRPRASALSCLDLSGQSVEWYTSYKLPNITNNVWRDLATGAVLIYQDVNNPGQWSRAQALVNDPLSHIARTIAPIYQVGKEELTYVLYNDQPPPDRQNHLDKGHAKGLIIFDNTSGIWLIHSVPNFPPPSTDGIYRYPSSGHLYGQQFMCLSLSVSQLDLVATQLYYNNVFVYDSNVPLAVKNSHPHLRLLLDRSAPPPRPYTSTLELTGVAGTKFVSFAKDGLFRRDLYDDDVAPYLQSDLEVEGWRNGNGNIPSECNGSYSVMNVNMIRFNAPTELDRDVQFDTNKDHSKWAVTTNSSNPWSCIGDINRQYGQFKRGGGTVCLRNALVWKAYNELVEGVDPCDHIQTPRRTKSSKKNRGQKKSTKQTLDSDGATPVGKRRANSHKVKRCRVLSSWSVDCLELSSVDVIDPELPPVNIAIKLDNELNTNDN